MASRVEGSAHGRSNEGRMRTLAIATVALRLLAESSLGIGGDGTRVVAVAQVNGTRKPPLDGD